MRFGVVLLLAVAGALGGCQGVPSAEQRSANDLNPSGRPYTGPVQTRVATPPADINTFNPIQCHPEGPGQVCNRENRATTTSAASNLW